MIKCLLSRPGLIAGPLHSTPLQIISQSIPRLDPIDSKSSYYLIFPYGEGFKVGRMKRRQLVCWLGLIIILVFAAKA